MNNKDCAIAHIDLDSFYASVECLCNPAIRHLPVAVGGDEENRHGIILAKNQIAKGFNIKTGETVFSAKQKCSNLVIVRGDFEKYIKYSRMVREIYKDYTDKIEPFGIDEAWLDLSASINIFGPPIKIVEEIQSRIYKEIGITASAGISYNKVFAKLGSDQRKPYGLFVVTRQNYKEKIWNLPVSDLLYVGRATLKKLTLLNIHTIGDLANADQQVLRSHLGKNGEMLKIFANGEDTTPVSKFTDERFVKSIGNSLTLPRDISANDEMYAVFCMISESVASRLRKHGLKTTAIQISIRDKNLYTFQMQGQLHFSTCISSEIAKKAYEIYLSKYHSTIPTRSVGIKCINLGDENDDIQLNLLTDNIKRDKLENLERTVDQIRGSYGYKKVQKGILMVDKNLTKKDIEKTNVIFPSAYLVNSQF